VSDICIFIRVKIISSAVTERPGDASCHEHDELFRYQLFSWTM